MAVKKIGIMLFAIGLLGVVVSFFGLVFKGLKPDETRIAGAVLMAGGVLIWVLGMGVVRFEDSLRKRKQAQLRPTAKTPDDIIK